MYYTVTESLKGPKAFINDQIKWKIAEHTFVHNSQKIVHNSQKLKNPFFSPVYDSIESLLNSVVMFNAHTFIIPFIHRIVDENKLFSGLISKFSI